MSTIENKPVETPPSGNARVLVPSLGTVIAVLACLSAAWIATGSLGLLAHPLRRILTLVALAVALLAPGICESRRWLRIILTPAVAAVAGCMVSLASPVTSVMATALVLGFLATLAAESNRDALKAGATAIAILGIFYLARTSIPWVWLGADASGRWLTHAAGAVSGRPLWAGATFAGLDGLLVMIAFWTLYARSTRPPRAIREGYGIAAILVGHGLYLLVLSTVANLETALPDMPGFLAGPLGKALPWNIPALLCVIDLAIVAAMLRWSTPAPARLKSGGYMASTIALSAAALAMAILLPVATLLYTKPLTATGKKIVFYEEGYVNWLIPTHDSYGRLASGMYGMLPAFVESLGAECVISPDLSQADLDGADALVSIFPDKAWPADQLERIDRFVREGGSLLVMGEHTTGDPNGNNRFNDLLESTSMRVRFDSATFAVGGWLDSYDAIAHPATTGIADDRNQFGVVIGASVEAKWPARPLLIGRWGWADPGDESSDQAMMGNGRYDSGEKLGDVVLAAEQPLGEGRVIVFGDTSGISNAINVSSHAFNARLLAYLTSGRDAHPMWRQLTGILVATLLIVLLLRRPGSWRVVLVGAGLTASLALCLSASQENTDILPDGRLKSPNNLAYIDTSGLSANSGESWRPDGLGGLALTLMRNGYMPLTLDEIASPRLERAGLLICGARNRPYSQAEVQSVEQFVSDGALAILTIGYDDADASRPLLDRFGFDFGATSGPEPVPLGYFKSPYMEANGRRVYVRFHAAWPIRCEDPNAQVIAYGRDNLPVILLCRVGSGKVLLIGDTFFASNQNLEHEDGTPFEGMRENADFWRWLIALLRDEEVWVPPALQSGPAQEVRP